MNKKQRKCFMWKELKKTGRATPRTILLLYCNRRVKSLNPPDVFVPSSLQTIFYHGARRYTI